MHRKNFRIKHHQDYISGHFKAMASPCEILIDTRDKSLAKKLLRIAEAEAKRIEQKFSRYQKNNIIFKINNSQGQVVEVDDETAGLLDYAHTCYELSDGMFDITSGVLGKVWHFDGNDQLPENKKVLALLEHVGWDKVSWSQPQITLAKGMAIDFGGIGKEYAVDRVYQLLKQQSNVSVLVNFGGDIYVSGSRSDGRHWSIGIDDPKAKETKGIAEITLERGGVTTSGDAKRFLLKDGVRYSHILNPRTGWPVLNAPRSVTVISGTATEAGIISTLAMLHGAGTEDFLASQDVKYWVSR